MNLVAKFFQKKRQKKRSTLFKKTREILNLNSDLAQAKSIASNWIDKLVD